MGRKSTKLNKSVYQTAREKLNLTREGAAERMPGMSPERIEKLENGRITVQPEDVMMMTAAYKAPSLCNYYCTHECAIGQKTVQEVKEKALSQIAVESLNALNHLDLQKMRLLEIVEDGQITPDEYDDFVKIKGILDKIPAATDSLQLWIDQQIADGILLKPEE